MERASHQVTRGEPEMRWGNTCQLYGCWGPQGNTKREKNGGGGIRGGEQGRFRGSEGAGFEGLRFGTALYAFLVMLFLCYKPTTFVQFLEREK
jgi:hypothetical protein